MPKNFSVLLVEDDDPLRAVLVDLLRQWGCDVFSTDAGDEAIALARRNPIDFSILDMHLPGTTGVEVFRTIRAEIGALPAILISGGASPADAARALELGMFRFLRKPLEIHTLRRTFDTLIAQHFGPRRLQ